MRAAGGVPNIDALELLPGGGACHDRAMSEELTTRSKPLAVQWPGVSEVPIHTANQFLAQVDAVGEKPDQLILAIGQLTPPPVLGTDEQKLAQMEQITEVNVVTLARYAITPARLAELIGLLQQAQHIWETGKIPAGEGMPA